jgi:hypothetical protein
MLHTEMLKYSYLGIRREQGTFSVIPQTASTPLVYGTRRIADVMSMMTDS